MHAINTLQVCKSGSPMFSSIFTFVPVERVDLRHYSMHLLRELVINGRDFPGSFRFCLAVYILLCIFQFVASIYREVSWIPCPLSPEIPKKKGCYHDVVIGVIMFWFCIFSLFMNLCPLCNEILHMALFLVSFQKRVCNHVQASLEAVQNLLECMSLG